MCLLGGINFDFTIDANVVNQSILMYFLWDINLDFAININVVRQGMLKSFVPKQLLCAEVYTLSIF